MEECLVKDTCSLFNKNTKTCEYMISNTCDKCNRMFRLNKLYDNSLISNVQRDFVLLRWDGDGTDKKEFEKLKDISNDMETFVKNGYNVYIHSAFCGNGKTSWALRMVQRYFSKIWFDCDITRCHALYINVPRFLLALKDNITEKSDYVKYIKDNVQSADIVIWDDIGTKSATQFEAEHLLSMIDARLNDNKSNIYTSNLVNDDLYAYLGSRLASRIINFSNNIEFRGVDKRNLKKFGG